MGFPRGGARRSDSEDREAGTPGRRGGVRRARHGRAGTREVAAAVVPVEFLRVAFCLVSGRQDVPILIKESGILVFVYRFDPHHRPECLCNAFCLDSSPPSIWRGS